MTEREFRAELIRRHGAEFQAKLSRASVAICGLGGLGSNAAISLIRLGIGRLRLIDFDRVELSNLHRQQYFPDQIGMFKTEALSETLRRISPWSELELTNARLTAANIPEILGNDDIICEALDSPESKAELVNTVLEKLPEKYLIAASGMAGLGDGNTIRTRRITGRFYVCGDGVSDVAGSTLTAPRVQLCAAHQALKIAQIIAEQK